MQTRVKLPSGPLIPYLKFCKAIAEAVSPIDKNFEGIKCVWAKIYTTDAPPRCFGKGVPYPLDETDRLELATVLQKLPPLRCPMSEDAVDSFMAAYVKLPDRPLWMPLLVTEEMILGFKIKHDQIMDHHIAAIREERRAGRLAPVDIYNVPLEAMQLGAHLTRKDAIAYLERHGLMYEGEEIAKGLKQDALKSEGEAQSLSGDEKKAAIVKFHAELKAKGDNCPSKKTAIEFNVVATYVRRLIREAKNAKKKEPSPGNRSVYKNGKEVVPPKRN